MVPPRTSPRSMAPPSRLGTVARVVVCDVEGGGPAIGGTGYVHASGTGRADQVADAAPCNAEAGGDLAIREARESEGGDFIATGQSATS